MQVGRGGGGERERLSIHINAHALFLLLSFLIEFQTIPSAFDDCVLYHHTKTQINFCCRWGLNLIFLIKQSETLLV